MTETTPGYAIALAAAEHEGRQQYIHELAAELIETAEAPDYPRSIKAAATLRGLTPAEYAANKNAGLKWCRTCEEWRALTDYKPSKSTRDGVRPLCDRHYTPATPAPLAHGYNGYQRGCRCTECRTGHTRYQTRMRAERRADPTRADRAGHGKRNTYNNYGCRCQACRAAQSDHLRARKARLRDQKGPTQ